MQLFRKETEHLETKENSPVRSSGPSGSQQVTRNPLGGARLLPQKLNEELLLLLLIRRTLLLLLAGGPRGEVDVRVEVVFLAHTVDGHGVHELQLLDALLPEQNQEIRSWEMQMLRLIFFLTIEDGSEEQQVDKVITLGQKRFVLALAN
jgi:hypothetical protein